MLEDVQNVNLLPIMGDVQVAIGLKLPILCNDLHISYVVHLLLPRACNLSLVLTLPSFKCLGASQVHDLLTS
jgi:hypothetical protein